MSEWSIPRSAGSDTLQVAVPAVVPWFVTEIVATIKPFVLPARISVTFDVNGPIPATARWPAIASPAIATPTARITEPWTCELAESLSPSGLHRSHRPTSSGIGAPHRAQPWVRIGWRGVGWAGVAGMGEVIAKRWCHGRAMRATDAPAITSGRRPRQGRRRRCSSGRGGSPRRPRSRAIVPRRRAARGTTRCRRWRRRRAARPQRPDDRDRLLAAGGTLLRLGEVDAIRGVLLRPAADPHAEHEPAAARDLEGRRHPGEDCWVTVHHVRHERPDGGVGRGRRGHREDRPALDDRHGPIALPDEVVPGPDAVVAGDVEPLRALQPPAGLGPDRPDRDADRETLGHVNGPLTRSDAEGARM